MARRNLTKLAKQLTPAYRRASPADVEDDVSLCVWVRSEAGEELTLKQAENLRKLLDAEIDAMPVSGSVVHSFPIYILDDDTILFPERKIDIDHSHFWETAVSQIVARQYHVPLEGLANMPYCQRRARIAGQNILYGEKPSKRLLRLIERAVGEKGLRFVYDDHEKRLDYDVQEFNALCLRS